MEICNGVDDDCDGEIDDGVLSACGNCDASCDVRGAGVGDERTPFVASEGNQVEVASDGTLLVRLPTHATNGIVWIPNGNDGTVSRVDAFSMTELARYRTGPNGIFDQPVATAIEGATGDLYVGNRGTGTILRISASGPTGCPDTNGDGVVHSATSPTDVLAWGEDDCVLWERSVGEGAQANDTSVAGLASGSELHGTTYRDIVWATDAVTNRLYKLDGHTGEVVFSVALPQHADPVGFGAPETVGLYGSGPLAYDDVHGRLWVGSASGARTMRIDTTRCVDEASCSVDFCIGERGDTCVRQLLPPTFVGAFALDQRGRLWVTSGVVFDPEGPFGSQITNVLPPAYGGASGVAVDDRGWAWFDAINRGIVRVSQTDPTMQTIVSNTRGLGGALDVDAEGKLWRLNYGTSDATVVAAAAELATNTVFPSRVTSLEGPIAVGPFATRARVADRAVSGVYRHVIDGCDQNGYIARTIQWNDLRWDAMRPDGASLHFRVRTGTDLEHLATARWADVADVPTAASPQSLTETFAREGIAPAELIEIEVTLTAWREESVALHSVDATYSAVCVPFG